MTNRNTDSILCKALATAAGFGMGVFLYFLWTSGVSFPGLLMAVGMTVFVSAITVAGAVLAFRSKEQ